MSEAEGKSVSDGSPHALSVMRTGRWSTSSSRRAMGVKAYIQILETDCDHLTRLIDFHRLPPEAFERASRPGPAWELEGTEREVPQVGVIDWRCRYPSDGCFRQACRPLSSRGRRGGLGGASRHLGGRVWPLEGETQAPARSTAVVAGNACAMQSSYLLSASGGQSVTLPPILPGDVPSAADGCSEGGSRGCVMAPNLRGHRQF